MHAARCNPLEKQQHLITVSSELQRAQHACEPCPDAPGPSLHLHLSSASSRAFGCKWMDPLLEFVAARVAGALATSLPAILQRNCAVLHLHLHCTHLHSIRLTHSALMLAGLALKHTLLLSARPPLVLYTLRFTS